MLRQIIKNIIDNLIAFECRFVRREIHAKKRVLIFRKDALGDFVIFLPTLEYYREYYKDYEISLVVSSTSIGFAPLFSFMDNIIIYDQNKFRTNFLYRRNFIKNLAKKGFNIAIYPVWSREPIGDLMMKVTKAREKITFKTTYDKNNDIYSEIFDISSNLNEFERNLAFVSKITRKVCTAKFPTININLLNNVDAKVLQKKYQLSKKKYCVLFPGAGASYRIWQLAKFAEISDYINQIGFIPVICGSQSETMLAEEIIKLASNKNIVNLSGQTDIPTLSHIINDSIFYFGSETGVLHIASALGVPAIAILGGGVFGRFFPYGDLEKNRIIFDKEMKCRNDNWECSKNLKIGEGAPCIKNIKVEDAKREIDSLLKIL